MKINLSHLLPLAIVSLLHCPLHALSSVQISPSGGIDLAGGFSFINWNKAKASNSMEQLSDHQPQREQRVKQRTQGDSIIPVGVIELRNYLIKHGQRDRFIDYFENNLIESQAREKGYVLGQYRIKNFDDRFFWIRSFRNMQERSSFLPAFYYGPEWQRHKAMANSMLANNDNVYLLRPLVLVDGALQQGTLPRQSLLIPDGGIVVVDFYVSNTRLPELLKLFASEYLPLLKQCNVNRYSLFSSVLEENDFPRLPVFQDKNLLVAMTFFDSELQYTESMSRIGKTMTADLKDKLLDVVTTKNTIVLYPTEKTTGRK